MRYLLPADLGLYFLGFTALWLFLLYPRKKGPETPNPEVQTESEKPKIPGLSGKIGQRIVPQHYAENIKKQLRYAGSPRNLSLERTLGLKISLALGAAILTVPLLFSGANPIWRLIITLALILVAFFLPDVWLSHRSDKRQSRIGLDLPDMLDLLTVSVEAGLSFDAALGKVVDNSTGPLTEEFFRLLQEVRLGVSRKQAFHNLEERTNAPALRYFILSMLQADTFGISIGKVLRTQSAEMKQKRRAKAEETAIKAPVKIMFPLILCIFPALMIVVLGPAGIRIYQTLTGLSR